MLDAIRNHTQGWLAKLILAMITIPFALFGIDSYLNNAGGNVAVAEIDGSKISVHEYGNAMENVRNRLQSEGQKVDAQMLESPAFKQSVLDGLIARHLVAAEIKKSKFTVSDMQLSQHILSMPEFQENGKFSEELYQKTLEQNKLTASRFESSIRTDMVAEEARGGLMRLAFVPTTVANQTLQFINQKRDASVAEIKTASFISQVKVSPEEVKAYYEQHKDKFKAPEQVKMEFALLSVSGLLAQTVVTDEEVKAFYDENASKFQGDEQRHASHILIAFGVGAKDTDKAAAKAKAEDILAQLRKNPKRFEEMATKYSQDPGSASKGGDLGSFGRGAMVKPFEDAVFSMKVNEISDVVESEFGYHIIKLTGITGASSSFESMKAQIKAELMFQKAQAKYAELTEDFSNTVYEQSGSLQPVAKKFNLQLQTTGWLSRDEGAKFFKSEKLMALVFSDEVMKEKRNTEAVEISTNNLVSARVLEYKPSVPRSFDEVKGGIEAMLKLEQALKLVKEKGEAELNKLKAGQKSSDLEWIPPVTVDRKNAQGLTDAVMNQVFKINTSKLPAYTGFMDEKRAYVLVEISRVNNNFSNDNVANEEAAANVQRATEAEYISAYLKSLKSKANISVNTKLLEVKN
ncbi:MAG TPA: SurA N-terminal domain-containing protein [Methylophilus sp.]|nr:SurA N-terminal domain-containing protein [Methylophilus sp.]